MNAEQASIVVRQAVPADAVSLNQILSAIVAIGGTTALQTPLTETEFSENFLKGDNCIVCFVAESTIDNQPIGFQALSRNDSLPDNWVDIATYSRPEPRTPGVGSALFRETKAAARDLGIVAINATIRADNQSGLPYYEKMGFRTYDILKDVLLPDGTPVDRKEAVPVGVTAHPPRNPVAASADEQPRTPLRASLPAVIPPADP